MSAHFWVPHLRRSFIAPKVGKHRSPSIHEKRREPWDRAITPFPIHFVHFAKWVGNHRGPIDKSEHRQKSSQKSAHIFGYRQVTATGYPFRMLPRRLHSFFLQCLILLAASVVIAHAEQLPAPAPSVAPTLVLDGLGKGAAPLDGQWQFHLGDDPSWANPDINDTAGQNGWEQLTADKPWGAQTHPNYDGFAWYRRHINVNPAPGASPDFALFIPGVDDTYQLYWNGTLVGALGNPPPHPLWYYHPPPRTFGIGPARSGVLAVRVWLAPGGSFSSSDVGGFVAAPILGSPGAISAIKDSSDYQWLRQRQFSFGIGALYILLSVLSFLAWMRDRRQRLIFWLAAWSGALSALFLLLSLRIPWGFIVSLGVAQPFFGIINISMWFLLALLLSLDEHPKLMRAIRFLAIVQMTAFTLDGLLVLLIPTLSSQWTVDFQWADGILTAIFTVLQTLPLVLIVYAVIVRPRLSFERWLVAICAFIDDMIPTLRIAFSQGVRFTHWTIAKKIAAPLFTVNGNRITPATLADTILLIAIIYAVYRYVAEERNRQSALEQEFQNARELQQVLIPEALPSLPGFTLTSAYKPAQEVGGDFFQIIPLVDGPLGAGSTLVILGDVSGKGLKAAMAVSLIVGATRMVAEFTTSPAEILAGLNRRLHGRLQGGFATCVAMRLDRDGKCTIASAGHPAPFLNDKELVLPGALPLGIAPDSVYDETTVSLKAGDHCALYTDGLLEARNPSGELYSFARLKTLFAGNPTAAQATEAAVNFGQDDDITVLTLTRLAAGESSTASHKGPILVGA